MPLVTITCSKSLYPPDDGSATDQAQDAVVVLAEALPYMISSNADELHLDQTPESGVQVDIRKFHPYAVNAVDLWIQVQFAESYPGREAALQVRDRLVKMLFLKMEIMPGLEVRRAVDLFWGSGHGHLWLHSAHNIKW